MSKMQYANMNTYNGTESPCALDLFLAHCNKITKPRVLELGVKRSQEDRSTMHKEWVPHAIEFTGTDIEAGQDVDIIADVHKLSDVIGLEQYDIVISCSSFEHFKYPHLAAFEISKVLIPNGIVFVQTHSTFPIHAYPYDYFRFTEEALSGCFGTKNGISVLKTDYAYPATISSVDDGVHPAWLNVNLFGLKVKKTPKSYIYELDTDL